ncbi:MAG: DUF2249 domain-containing protein [Burkholderiales bacterium]
MCAADTSDFHIVLDTRRLEPPEPIVRALDALDLLPVGKEMLLLVDRDLHALLRALDLNGYEARWESDAAGGFRVVVWQPRAARPSTDAP